MSREIKKVLVIKLGALGDFVLALAAMKRIRAAHPKARITLLTTPPFEGLARSSGYFNVVETDGRPGAFSEWLRMIRRLRKARYDRVYDLQTSSSSSRIFQFLRPFPPQWSGIAAGAQLKQRTKGRASMHTLERQADQLRVAGIWPDAPTAPGEAPPPDLSWILKKAPPRGPQPHVGALEGMTGIEPALSAWEAEVLPLNYIPGHAFRRLERITERVHRPKQTLLRRR